MKMRNFNQFTLDDCIVVVYFFITNVSNFTRDSHKLFVLTSKRIYDSELSFLGADKWPEMKKSCLELG